MAYALVSHRGDAIFHDGGTGGSIDTTGADLLVAVVGYHPGGAGLTLTDSKGNTWVGLTARSGASYQAVRLWYAWNAIVGTGHTLTFGGVGSLPTLEFLAFSGSLTSSDPFDLQNGASSASASSLAPGSITPSTDNQLVICGGGYDVVSGSPSIGGGFTIADFVNSAGGNNIGSGAAYLIQTSAAAANPTWTSAGTSPMGAVIASFKSSVVAAPQTPYQPWQQRAPILAQ